MIIHKIICDWCKKEKNLDTNYFGTQDIWQTIIENEQNLHRKICKDFCSTKCVVDYFLKVK